MANDVAKKTNGSLALFGDDAKGFDNMTQEFENIQDIKEEFESLELKMLKEEELNWDQKQSVQNAIENAKIASAPRK